jgi:predicted dehydrogenase/threonine dehydrogenase-like Zn-dependent dehydrogenase
VKQILIQRGTAVAENVPAPMIEPGTALIRVQRSCISIGTELSGLKRSGMPMWQLAARYPEQVKKTVETVATLGVARTWSLVQGQLAAGTAVGYSAAGVVLEVGDGLDTVRPGDRVACAGAQCAHHAEVVRVPRNLMTRIPDGVSFDHASTVALGAIAMQGVRRAMPTLGETFVVIGLGVIGQLTAQLLRANGCRVIGIDLDAARIAMARQMGMSREVHAEDGSDVSQVLRMADGIGADGVIITAATPSDAVVSTAFKMCRRKGRVVLVGDVGLHLSRGDFYQKEIDFFISCSYGPGRYDAGYEEGGADYPLGYVRWTENRNMQEYLRLIAVKSVQVQPMITATYPVEHATAAYETLQGDRRPLLVLLSYPDHSVAAPLARVAANPKPLSARAGAVRMALVGAGGFAKGMHLPNLQALGDLCHLQAVVSRSGDNAAATARRWGAQYAGTDYQTVLDDPEVDAVIIATRHNLHATMALAALRAGKHVLLEKPLALTESELAGIEEFFAAAGPSGAPILLTGFNRRFSAHARRAREWVARRSHPMLLNYRMNAGYLPPDHWTQLAEGGGRNLGEACHIYDLFTYLTGARIKQVQAAAIRPTSSYYKSQDNFTTSLSFDDGSVATLTYTGLGSKDHPKERLEVYVDGKVIVLEDFKSLTVAGGKGQTLRTRLPEKGQKEELEAFAKAIQHASESPIPFWEQVQATRIAFAVETALEGTAICAAS